MTRPIGTIAAASPTLALWQKMPKNRLGAALYSAGVVARAPYFGTILPTVREIRPGYSEVTAPKWFGIRNHIGTFHAIAACNLAELSMGMVMEATVPVTHRWIPKSMTTQYLAKATTGLRAVATLEAPLDSDAVGNGAEVSVAVVITDDSGKEVVHCDIICWVTPSQDVRIQTI